MASLVAFVNELLFIVLTSNHWIALISPLTAGEKNVPLGTFSTMKKIPFLELSGNFTTTLLHPVRSPERYPVSSKISRSAHCSSVSQPSIFPLGSPHLLKFSFMRRT